MKLRVHVELDELIHLAKQLSAPQWRKLKQEVEKSQDGANDTSELETLLLNAPTIGEEQLEEIAKTRKAINQWRKN